MRYKADVRVTLKRGVLDPQGAAVQGALATLGYRAVEGVRVGKFIEVWLEAASEEEARAQVEEICRRLLANPVLETYRFDLQVAAEGPGAQPALTVAGAAGGEGVAGAGAAPGAAPGAVPAGGTGSATGAQAAATPGVQAGAAPGVQPGGNGAPAGPGAQAGEVW